MTADRIPRGALERLIDKYAPEGVDLIDDPVVQHSDEEHQRAVTAWAQRQIDDGAVTIGGVREYDDGTFVAHEELQRVTGARPHASKRGDEGTDLSADMAQVAKFREFLTIVGKPGVGKDGRTPRQRLLDAGREDLLEWALGR